MASAIEGDVARIEAALNTPTIKLLDRKSAAVALPIFVSLFAGNAEPIPVERFYTRVEALLDEIRSTGRTVPASTGKALAMQWVRERWLFRDPGRGQETFSMTGDAQQALEYVTRATRTQVNVSVSRIETLRRVVSETAMAAHPDSDERMRRLSMDIAMLTAEYDYLKAGGLLEQVSESELAERFQNVLRELDGLPADFRRVEESVREMHKTITTKLREEERPVGEVLDEYMTQNHDLLTATPEGRAFNSAQELLRAPDWLSSLRRDLETIIDHPLAGTMLPDEILQLRTAVDVIRSGIAGVLEQRHRLSTTLREFVENYDHVRNRELEQVLRGIDREMRTWMESARARHHVEVELIPPGLDIETMKLRVFDPDSERAPEPLADLSGEAPAGLSLDDIRKQGGPSLEQFRSRIDKELAAGGAIESAAALFNDLPDDLRRPVEILGLLHLLARMGVNVDTDRREQVRAIRPDQTTRSLLMPALSIPTTQITPTGETR
jgi:hypothetical protein